MSLHILEASMSLPLPRKEVFAFFSNAVNLQNITPPELHFRILTPQPIPMQEGTLIDYRLSLFGVPLRFHDTGEATIIEDVVHYRLPFGPFGDLFHPLVRLQLERIFRYRQTAVRAVLVGAVDGSYLGDRTGARS
jgi:ligand-binding SRPBCC domain-containing protein